MVAVVIVIIVAPVAIVVSTPGRTGGVILSEQVTMSLKRNGVSADQARLYSDYVNLAIGQIEKEGTIPPNPPPGLEGLFPASAAKLLQVELGFDPTTVLPVYDGPVLVMQGEKDVQISATRDTPLLEMALKQRQHGNGRYEVIIVPSASHNLKKVENENVDPGITGSVVHEALDKIAAWMKRTFPD